MKTVVIYKSKNGYTKIYAEWLAEDLNCDLIENTHVNLNQILQYDTIIYGGGMYAGGINGLKLIKKNLEPLMNKNLILWATGMNPGNSSEMEDVWKRHFTEEQRNRIKTFYLRGGFDYSKLGLIDKLLMNMLKVQLKKQKNPSEDTLGMLHAYEVPADFCSKANIDGLVTYVRSLKAS